MTAQHNTEGAINGDFQLLVRYPLNDRPKLRQLLFVARGYLFNVAGLDTLHVGNGVEQVGIGERINLLLALDYLFAARLADIGDVAFPTAWSGAAVALGVPIEPALTAWAWAWAENQVMAAIKAVPLGQTAGQRLLMTLGEDIPPRVATALTLPREDWSNFAPGLAIASSRHETQDSRLFRS